METNLSPVISCPQLGIRRNEIIYPLTCTLNKLLRKGVIIDCHTYSGCKWSKGRHIASVLPMFLVVMIFWRIDALPPSSNLVEKDKRKRRSGKAEGIVDRSQSSGDRMKGDP